MEDNSYEKKLNEEYLPEFLLKQKRDAVEKWKDYIKVGDIYVDSFGHPTLCTTVDFEDIDIGLEGISLLDGSYPRGCGLVHEGIEKISVEEAYKIKMDYNKSQRKISGANTDKNK